MLLVEPASVYILRTPCQFAEPWRAWPCPETDLGIPVDQIWIETVYALLQANNCAPIRITSLVNDLARLSGYSCRPEREAKKVKLFKLITRLFRLGALRRVDRCFVSIPNIHDARFQVFIELATRPLDLPLPQV